ncbi:MAG: AMP-binding protein, partial [Acidilobus sp.]
MRRGYVVPMMMPNVPEAVCLGLAVHRLGAAIAIHYVGLCDEVLAARLNDAGSRIIVVTSKGLGG